MNGRKGVKVLSHIGTFRTQPQKRGSGDHTLRPARSRHTTFSTMRKVIKPIGAGTPPALNWLRGSRVPCYYIERSDVLPALGNKLDDVSFDAHP